MKAIYQNRLYLAVDDVGDDIVLEDNDGKRITVKLSDPSLIVDPTDDEVAGAE